MAVTMTSAQARAILGGIGAPSTPQNVNFLLSWSGREGIPQNIDANNWLGTTLRVGGSYGTNGPGVQHYGSAQDGIAAHVRMLDQQNFSAIRQALKSGNPSQFAGNPEVQKEFRSWSGGGYSFPVSGGGAARVAASPSVAASLAGRTAAQVPQPQAAPQVPQTDYQPLLAQALSQATGDNYQQFYATLTQALQQRNRPAPQPTQSMTPAAGQMVQPHSAASGGKAGGFLPGNASYKVGRVDQGHDFQTDPGAPIVAPGDGTVVAVKSDPHGFGPAYPIVHFTSGPYAGKDIYIGHTLAALKPGASFRAGQTISRTGTTPVGNASVPGWAEIGFSNGQLPTGQRPPF